MPPTDHQQQLFVRFDSLSKKYATQNSRLVQGICAFAICFGMLGLSWALPFPHLGFLGQYNSYFNWASFVIAISIYYYASLSPLLSYLMLFLALIFTYLISIIEKQIADPVQLGILFGVILLLSFAVHVLHHRSISNDSTIKTKLDFIWIGPIWILSFMLKKFNLKY